MSLLDVFKVQPINSSAINNLSGVSTLDRIMPLPSTPVKVNPVKNAISIIKSAETVVVTQETLDSIARQIDEQRAIKNKLFAIEQDAQNFVQRKIITLLEQQAVCNSKLQHQTTYLPIDHSILGWRDSRGFPTLGLFSLDNDVFRIGYYDFVPEMTPKLDEKLYNYYSDVFDKVTELTNKRNPDRSRYLSRSSSVSAHFKGVIPESTREKIIKAQKDFKQIYIIAEVDMKFESSYVEIGDPIAAGWDGTQLWYIDDFDTTAVEEAALLIGPNNK